MRSTGFEDDIDWLVVWERFLARRYEGYAVDSLPGEHTTLRSHF
jgi:hypothetical protein